MGVSSRYTNERGEIGGSTGLRADRSRKGSAGPVGNAFLSSFSRDQSGSTIYLGPHRHTLRPRRRDEAVITGGDPGPGKNIAARTGAAAAARGRPIGAWQTRISTEGLRRSTGYGRACIGIGGRWPRNPRADGA